MKRIISILIALSLFLVMLTPLGVSAAEEQAGRYTEAIEFLTAVGIIEAIDETTIADPITREDFAVYLANLMGVDTQRLSEKRYFKDLSMNSYGTYSIEALVDRGVISLPDDRKFRPVDTITLAECAKMICVATGYQTYAEMNGGFPNGYLTVAKRNEITPEILNKDAVSLEEAAEMLYRAGQLSLYETNSVASDGWVGYTAEKGATLLSVNHSIYFDKGIVTSICGQSTVKEIADYEDIYIDKKKFASEEVCRDAEILGEYVKYFYRYDKKSETKTVVHMVNKADAETLKISIDDFSRYSGGKLTYFGGSDGNKQIEQSIENPNIIYNGYPIGEKVSEMFKNLNKGYISLKDSNNNGSYDTIIVNDYKNLVVNYIDIKDEAIYNKLNSVDNVKFKEFENIIIWDENYNAMSLDDLAAGDVLAVAKSKNGAVVSVIRTSSIFNGVLETTKNVGKDGLCITVGGKDYMVEKSYKTKFSELTLLGGVYYYSLDFLGNICYVDVADGSGLDFGWVIASNVEEEAFSKKLQLKMLAEDSSCKIYDLADRVRVDGKACKKADEVYAALTTAVGADVEEFLIRYALNDAGLIKEIDTTYVNPLYENDKNSLTSIYGTNFGQHYGRADRIGLKAYVNNETLAFGMPMVPALGGATEDSEYIIGNATGLAHDSLNTCNVYTTNVLNDYSSAVVYKYEFSTIDANYLERTTFMVDGIGMVLNDEGEAVRQLRGYLAGTYMEYEIDDAVDLRDIEQGDLVKLHFDMNGRVIPSYDAEPDVVILYDYSLWQGGRPDNSTGVWKNIVDGGQCYLEVGTASYGGYHARMQLSFGFVNSKGKDMIRIGYANGENFDEIFNTKSVKVTVYDRTASPENRIYIGTIDDILDYDSVGGKCSTVLVHTRDCDPKSLIVYR